MTERDRRIYDAWRVSPPCDATEWNKECPGMCPYFTDCYGDNVEEEDE